MDLDADQAALADVTTGLLEALGSIREDQWELPTPCTDWDLTALVDHVVGGNWFTARVLAGETAERAIDLTMAQFAGGSASQREAIESAREQLEAFGSAGVLDQTWHHVAGSLSGRQILQLRVHDLIVHTWDINEALSPSARVPDQLVRWGLDELDGRDSPTASHFEILNVPRPDSSSEAQGTYLAAFGRRSSL